MTTRDDLVVRIKILSERLWENRCRAPDVDDWLSNFSGRHGGRDEELHALHLLASVSYFGLAEIRVLLRAMYRDLFRYPIIQELRSSMGGTRDESLIQPRFEAELERTRFLGMGTAAESGTHLLYFFRQENRLPRHLFVSEHDLFSGPVSDDTSRFEPTDLKHVVFVDDLCATGRQATQYGRTLLEDIRAVARRTGQPRTVSYLLLFATEEGIKAARAGGFDRVDTVNEIDETYQTFGPESRLFRNPIPDIDRDVSEKLARGYGGELWPRWPLGYGDCQLLLAFHHNVPDNSLPILWSDEGEPPWIAAFPRQPKLA